METLESNALMPQQDDIEFYPYQNSDQWAWAIAVAVSSALRRALQQHGSARLLVSGGTTPAPVFEALSLAPLEWENIDIALVDERWQPPDDADSNAHLVREHLLRNQAEHARFQPLTRPGSSIEQAVSDANQHSHRTADVVLLGMGNDGHTASLFPNMHRLDAALASPNAYVAVDASACPGAGPWPRRISLTPAGLMPAKHRLLLIRGEEKRAVFQSALEGTDAHEMPVRIAFTTPGADLHVYWCP